MEVSTIVQTMEVSTIVDTMEQSAIVNEMELTLINKEIINKSDVLNILSINDLTIEKYYLILNYLLNSFDKILPETFNIIPTIKYLLFPIDKFVNNYIIFGKNKDKLIENDIDLPKFTLFDKSKDEWCRLAATNGHLECLKYAHENDCSWDKWICAYAAGNNYIECLKYAHENGCPWDEWTCLFAAKHNSLECLKYAHENGCPWDSYTCSYAAEGGHLECLKYAHINGCPWDEYTCMYAASRSHLECLKYAHQNGCEYNKTELLLVYNVKCKQYIELNM
jgi:hypothetical protein